MMRVFRMRKIRKRKLKSPIPIRKRRQMAN
jgi:hypothetical protein